MSRYQIKYSSATRYGVYVNNGGHELCVKENLTEQEAINLQKLKEDILLSYEEGK